MVGGGRRGGEEGEAEGSRRSVKGGWKQRGEGEGKEGRWWRRRR